MRSLPPSARSAVDDRRSRRGTGRALVLTVLVAAGLVATAPSAWAETTHVLALANSIHDVLTNLRNRLMGFLALLATVFVTVGGVRYVAANGDPGEVEKAKQSFKGAGWGYALAALAPLLVEILRGIVGA